MAALTERSRCGIHGDPTSSGRCASCDRVEPNRIGYAWGSLESEALTPIPVVRADCDHTQTICARCVASWGIDWEVWLPVALPVADLPHTVHMPSLLPMEEVS